MTTHPTMTNDSLREDELNEILYPELLFGKDSLMAHWSAHNDSDQQFADLITEHIVKLHAQLLDLISKECDRADRGARKEELEALWSIWGDLTNSEESDYIEKRLRELTTPERSSNV